METSTYNNKGDVKITIQQLFDSLHQSSSNPCIRKVPECMSELSKSCEPSIVSIGPVYYNNKPALQPFYEMKVRHLQYFIKFGCERYDLSEYINIVRDHENQIRSFYEGTVGLSSNDFIEMVLIDAAFIIIFFMWHFDEVFKNPKPHPMDSKVEVACKVNQDIFLVANQLPFFVINDLYVKAFGEVFSDITFKDLTRWLIKIAPFPGGEVALTSQCIKRTNESNIKHFVDFLRIVCRPSMPRDNRSGEKFPKSTVKDLKAAGVKFAASSESESLLDITFSKGVLQIPILNIQDVTNQVIRSIAFFEQCHHFNDSYIIDYLAFIDALIDTPEDVQILVKNGIIKQCLGSDKKVATFFNQITKDLIIKNPGFYYSHLSEELNAYADTRWNKWKAVLRRDYFNHPWSVISLIYLGVLLILTAFQAYTSFKG